MAKQTGDYHHLKEMYTNTFSSWEDISNTFKMVLLQYTLLPAQIVNRWLLSCISTHMMILKWI